MSDVAKIAEGLTEAQRSWLIATEATTDRVAKTPCSEWWDNPERLFVVLDGVEYWLAGRGLCSPADCAEFTEGWEQLSLLGLAIREHLIKGEKG